MLVKNVMNRNVIVAKPSITIKEASQVMSKLHIGSLVIVKEEKIVGILTERDVLNAVASGRKPEITLAEEIMSKPVITIEPDKRIDEAVDLMMKNKIKKIPVVRNGELKGIITASDIVVVEPKLIEKIARLVSIKIPGYRGG